MVRQRIKATQKPQHNLKRHLFADGEHLKVHARTDALLGVTHRGAQLCALFVREPFLHFRDNVGRQVFHEVGDFVGIERFNRVNEFIAVHRLDEGLAHAVIDFNENIAFTVAVNQLPDGEAVILRERFKHVGDVSRMQVREDLL